MTPINIYWTILFIALTVIALTASVIFHKKGDADGMVVCGITALLFFLLTVWVVIPINCFGWPKEPAPAKEQSK